MSGRVEDEESYFGLRSTRELPVLGAVPLSRSRAELIAVQLQAAKLHVNEHVSIGHCPSPGQGRRRRRVQGMKGH